MKKMIVALAAALLMAAPVSAQQAAQPAAKPAAKPAAAAPAAAAGSIAGKWSGESQGQQGPMKNDMEIKTVAAGKLTGMMGMGAMGNLELKDGTVAGTKVSFTTDLNYQGQILSIKYSGEAKGDEMVMNSEIPGMGAGMMPPVTFKRVK